MRIFKTLIALFFTAIAVLPVFAQENNVVIVYGKFKIEWGDNEQSKISLYEDGKVVEQFYPKNNGKFEFPLKLNHQYLFWFEKPGYVTKKIDFNTQVPESVLSNPDFEPFPDFDFYVTLFKVYPDVDTMFFTKPVGKIKYSAAINDFDYDKEYNLEVERRMEEIEEDIKRKNAEEVEKLANNKKNKPEQDVSEAKNEVAEEVPNEIVPVETENQEQASTSQIQTEPIPEEEPQIKPNQSLAQDKANTQQQNNVATLTKSKVTPTYEQPRNTVQKQNITQTEVAGRTVTRTEVTQGNMTLVYIKVEYTWGGRFFFIQDETNEFRNISETYYNLMTRKQ